MRTAVDHAQHYHFISGHLRTERRALEAKIGGEDGRRIAKDLFDLKQLIAAWSCDLRVLPIQLEIAKANAKVSGDPKKQMVTVEEVERLIEEREKDLPRAKEQLRSMMTGFGADKIEETIEFLTRECEDRAES